MGLIGSCKGEGVVVWHVQEGVSRRTAVAEGRSMGEAMMP